MKPLPKQARIELAKAYHTAGDGTFAFSRRSGIAMSTLKKAIQGSPVRADVHDRVHALLISTTTPGPVKAQPRAEKPSSGKPPWERVLDLIDDDRLSPELLERAFALAEAMWKKEQAL